MLWWIPRRVVHICACCVKCGVWIEMVGIIEAKLLCDCHPLRCDRFLSLLWRGFWVRDPGSFLLTVFLSGKLASNLPKASFLVALPPDLQLHAELPVPSSYAFSDYTWIRRVGCFDVKASIPSFLDQFYCRAGCRRMLFRSSDTNPISSDVTLHCWLWELHKTPRLTSSDYETIPAYQCIKVWEVAGTLLRW